MNFNAIYNLLLEEFGDKILEKNEANIDQFIVVEPTALLEIMKFLKSAEETSFDFLSCISGVDYPEAGIIEVVYHLFSYSRGGRFIVKVRLPREKPAVDSLCLVWKAADWLEREVYDLFGVEFYAHPDLRRILLPEDWEGHPLRKDYQEPAEYHGIPNK